MVEWHHHLMLGGGAEESDELEVRGAGMDPVSVTDCSWAAAGIPKRRTMGMAPVKGCRGYMSAQQSSGGQAQRATEKFFVKVWHFHPFAAIASWFSAETLSR